MELFLFPFFVFVFVLFLSSARTYFTTGLWVVEIENMIKIDYCVDFLQKYSLVFEILISL